MPLLSGAMNLQVWMMVVVKMMRVNRMHVQRVEMMMVVMTVIIPLDINLWEVYFHLAIAGTTTVASDSDDFFHR